MLSNINLGLLPRADGSATCTAHGCKVIASVNGPVEVTRRDELPEEATVEITIRPVTGVGGLRERHFESLLHKVLRHAIRVKDHPRALVQITLQIASWAESSSWSGLSMQAATNIRALPALLNAATLALLSSTIPLNTVLVATMLGINDNGSIVQVDSSDTAQSTKSLHVFAFSLDGKLALAESEGSFDMQSWEQTLEEAQHHCISQEQSPGQSDTVTKQTLVELIKSTIQAKAVSAAG